MAKIGTCPTTYDERKFIAIADLRKWGYLIPESWKSGTVTWRRNGEVISTISIWVDTIAVKPSIRFTYTWQEQNKDYKVSLVHAPSNLGIGQVYYFLCPFTNRRCRKLYFINGYFQHREAIKGYYEKQIQSKYYRYLQQTYGPMFQQDKLYEELYSKHFRKFYNGKPTKRYLKITAQLKAAEGVSEKDFINAMCKRK